MAGKFVVGVLLVLSLINPALSMDPSPSPEPAAESPSVSAPSPSPDTGSPSEPPISPAPSDLFSHDSPPAEHPESPAPASEPTEASDINHSNNVEASDGTESEGISGGKKAGIVIGVIAAACFVGLGGFVYKKRQQNIRRSRYAAAARTELL